MFTNTGGGASYRGVIIQLVIRRKGSLDGLKIKAETNSHV